MTSRRDHLRRIAERTLEAIDRGYYILPGPPTKRCDLRPAIAASTKETRYHGPDSSLSSWKDVALTSSPSDAKGSAGGPQVIFMEISSIEGTRYLASTPPENAAEGAPPPTIGILNFASATKPGGGFLTGAQAQEESIARSSTLYPSLITPTAKVFHTIHKKDKKGGYYTHACIYSPGVLFFRDDAGGWTEPLQADILTSAAVNAGVARKSFFGTVGGAKEEERIEAAMRERMGRVLALFEREGVRHIVLGAFGTGVFQNDVSMVGRVWADLFSVEGARFWGSFDRIMFAILGTQTFDTLQDAFERRRDSLYNSS